MSQQNSIIIPINKDSLTEDQIREHLFEIDALVLQMHKSVKTIFRTDPSEDETAVPDYIVPALANRARESIVETLQLLGG
jgi:hypothetical protein